MCKLGNIEVLIIVLFCIASCEMRRNLQVLANRLPTPLLLLGALKKHKWGTKRQLTKSLEKKGLAVHSMLILSRNVKD